VLFDLGGTCLSLDHDRIAHIARAHGAAPAHDWVHAAEARGRDTLEASLEAGEPHDAQWRAFFDGMLRSAGVAAEALEGAFADLVAWHREHHLWKRIMPGMPETLRALSERGYRLAVVSNSDGRAEALLTQLGIAHEFEFVVDSHVVGVEKPDPRIFAIAVDRLGLHASQCAYVGDVDGIDVRGARAAGLWPVLLDVYGSYPRDDDSPRAAEPAQLLGLFARADRGDGGDPPAGGGGRA
jgi:putative hydrolase of the HAD superfamily